MKRTQISFETFKDHLVQALTHLYDPAFQPSEVLAARLGSQPETVQGVLRRAIINLKPAPDTPASARGWRVYQVLDYRYLQSLTQEEAAFRLGISPRHLRREQQQAVEVLARRLWEQDEPPPPAVLPENDSQTDELTWRSQVREDLASLQEHAPGVIADLSAVVQGLVPLAQLLAGRHQLRLDVRPIPAGLLTSIHPTLLRQILLTAIEKQVQYTSPGGQVVVTGRQQANQIALQIIGEPASPSGPVTSEFIHETLSTQGGVFTTRLAQNRLVLQLGLPSAERIRVLVVDDNVDLVHFYKRYTAQTRYDIVHLSEGSRLFELVPEVQPHIIVLDVMLPDIDGWELLTRLYEHPDTREIPVIVCSVVRREELALALGARLYLPKPVRRRAFIQALDRVLLPD
ncbi:MAG: response regulator [Chloroflexi bacterium]|nr:MAG: response regulator [Chloroflexota bacterium]